MGRSEKQDSRRSEDADEDELLESELGRDSDTEQNNASYNNNSDSLFEDCDKMEDNNSNLSRSDSEQRKNESQIRHGPAHT